MKILVIKIIPNSKKEGVTAVGPLEFKVKVAALAQDGAANEAVIKQLALYLHTKTKHLSILSGHKNPHKRIAWEDGEDKP